MVNKASCVINTNFLPWFQNATQMKLNKHFAATEHSATKIAKYRAKFQRQL